MVIILLTAPTLSYSIIKHVQAQQTGLYPSQYLPPSQFSQQQQLPQPTQQPQQQPSPYQQPYPQQQQPYPQQQQPQYQQPQYPSQLQQQFRLAPTANFTTGQPLYNVSQVVNCLDRNLDNAIIKASALTIQSLNHTVSLGIKQAFIANETSAINHCVGR